MHIFPDEQSIHLNVDNTDNSVGGAAIENSHKK